MTDPSRQYHEESYARLATASPTLAARIRREDEEDLARLAAMSPDELAARAAKIDGMTNGVMRFVEEFTPTVLLYAAREGLAVCDVVMDRPLTPEETEKFARLGQALLRECLGASQDIQK